MFTSNSPSLQQCRGTKPEHPFKGAVKVWCIGKAPIQRQVGKIGALIQLF